MRGIWRTLIALVGVAVFVALLMLNTSALAELAWASLAGRFGRRAQLIGVALLLIVAASLIVPLIRAGLAAPETAAPVAPDTMPAVRPRAKRRPPPSPPGDTPKRAPDAAAKRAKGAKRSPKAAGRTVKSRGGKGGGSSRNPR